MARRGRGRGGDDGGRDLRTLVPTSTEVLAAWTNLLMSIIATMRHEGVGADTIHGFLDHLDVLNMETLTGDMLGFVLFITDEVRRSAPSND